MYFSGHNHSHGSNFRLRDSIIKETKLIDKAIKLGFKGVALTDHECISRHISFLQHMKMLKEQKKELEKIKESLSINELKKRFKEYELIIKMDKDFKIGLGDEIYLVDSLEEVRDKYTSRITKFPHFILIAKDLVGHKQLRKISSEAWKNSFYTGKMERTPIQKKVIKDIIGEDKGHLIASTACLGGELAIHIMNYLQAEEQEKITYKRKIHQFIKWCLNIFGEDFYLELQPSFGEEQIEVNKMLLQLSESYKIKYIITTDTHYLNKEDISIHSAYLNSSDGDRETESFYATTYMMSIEEMWEYFKDYLSKEVFDVALNNSLEIHKKIEEYDLLHGTIVPELKLEEFELSHIFKEYYSQYKYINSFANSEFTQDKYFLYLIEKGFIEKKQEFNDENISRIDVELEQLWEISEKLNQRLSAYYVLIEKIVEIMWDDNMGNSLVGVARGSVTGFYTAYLSGITQMNPIKWNLPYWRHISKERPELPDIDIDSASNKRQGIFEALKKYFGYDNVVNICTFKTEGSKSAVLTVCRGMGIDNDISQYIADLIPFERGSNWSINECFNGNDENGRKPVKEFINEINKYEGLKEGILAIEGLICGRSIHASGVYIFKNGYIEQNAVMKAPNGKLVTAWNMVDSDYCGGLKFDALTIEALDKIRATMDLLLKENIIEWQGSLRKTYNKYLHPDIIDYKTLSMWKMIGNGEIIDLFQFSTQMGIDAGKKIAPTDLYQMASANSIMRLMSEGEEQPIDVYVKFKNDISLWYKEMRDFGLNEEEIKVLEKHLLSLYGVADTQESIMLLSMDKEISNFTLQEANKLRKSVAKKKKKLIEEIREHFYEKGLKNGTRKIMLEYVWEVQIKRQLGYSFSSCHTFPYSTIGVQEMNLAYHYNILYWDTACLIVNAGADENNEDNKNTDYGKVAKAIGEMQNRGIKVDLPHINKAEFGFYPDVPNNSIVFGLKGINGLGDDVATEIVKNKPYKSFEDFMNKMVLFENSPVKQGQVVILIKSGAFDSLENIPREVILRKYVDMTTEKKVQIDFKNLSTLIKYNVIPNEYALYKRYFKYRKYVFSKKFFYKQDEKAKSKQHYELDDISEKFFIEHFMNELQDGKDYYYNENGKTVVINKNFDNLYNKKMEAFKKILPNLIEPLNNAIVEETYKDLAQGNISSWEMEALSFYYHEHELINLKKEQYSVSNFFELPESPVVTKINKTKKGDFKQFELTRIAGTVLGRDKIRHVVTLLTTDGVVNVKYYAGQFTNYDKQLSEPIEGTDKKRVIEKGWFTKGTKLLLTGFRRGDQFIARTYKDSIFLGHSTMKIININNEGELELQLDRKKVGEDISEY